MWRILEHTMWPTTYGIGGGCGHRTKRFSVRDIRVMGAQNSDSKKMGAAHYFFFFEEPIFSKKKLWAGRPSCAHYFFFCDAHFLRKKIMGNVPIEFVLFSAWSQQFVLVKLLEVGF